MNTWCCRYPTLIQIIVSFLRVLLNNRSWTSHSIISPRLQTSIRTRCSSFQCIRDLFILVVDVVSRISLSTKLSFVSSSIACSSMTSMSWSRVIRSMITHLKDLPFMIFDVFLIAIIMYELFHDFWCLSFVFIYNMAICVQTAMFAVLILILVINYEVWSMVRTCSGYYIWIRMVVLLYLFSYASSSHETFIVWVLIVRSWLLIFQISLEVFASMKLIDMYLWI